MRLLINGTPVETKKTDAAGTVSFSPLSVLPSTGFRPGENTVSVEYGGGDIAEDLDSSAAKAVLYVSKVPVELKTGSYPSVPYNGQSQIPEYTLVLSDDKTEVLPELLPAKTRYCSLREIQGSRSFGRSSYRCGLSGKIQTFLADSRSGSMAG